MQEIVFIAPRALALTLGKLRHERAGRRLGTHDKSIFLLGRTHLHGNESGINKPSASGQVCCVNWKAMRSW